MKTNIKCPISNRFLNLVDILPGTFESKIYKSTDKKGNLLIYQSFRYNNQTFLKLNYNQQIRYFKIKNRRLVEYHTNNRTDNFEIKHSELLNDIGVEFYGNLLHFKRFLYLKALNLLNKETHNLKKNLIIFNR